MAIANDILLSFAMKLDREFDSLNLAKRILRRYEQHPALARTQVNESVFLIVRLG